MTAAASAAVELGLGARRALSVDGRGRVVAVYRRAAYLRVPGGLVALTTADVWRGPLHVRSAVAPDRLAPGDVVGVVGGSEVRVGRGGVVDLGSAVVWEGARPDLAALGSGIALLDLFAAAPLPALVADERFAGRLGVALRRLRQGDLAGVAQAIGGIGPGLTPAGDDTLAGILLVARLRGGAAVEDELVAVAGSVPTTSVAQGLLEWAARGQSVEPAHDLLAALAGGDLTGAAVHLSALGRIGHTSGADLAYGLRLGLGVGVGVVSPA